MQIEKVADHPRSLLFSLPKSRLNIENKITRRTPTNLGHYKRSLIVTVRNRTILPIKAGEHRKAPAHLTTKFTAYKVETNVCAKAAGAKPTSYNFCLPACFDKIKLADEE